MSASTSVHSDPALPIVVIGAGPVGLAAAAHLLEHGLEPLILEAGDDVGAAIRQWGHTRLFSPWRYDLDAACTRLLEAADWAPPRPTALPWGRELVQDYLQPLAQVPGIRDRLRTRARVLAVTRGTRDKTHARGREGSPFLLRAQEQTDEGPRLVEIRARAVIDASGTWGAPNPAGAAGLPALGEQDPAVIPHLTGSLPDVLGTERERFAGQRTLVVGAGHSATNTLLDLAQLARETPGTEVHWAIRGQDPSRTYGGRDADGLPARGMLGTRLQRAVESGVIQLHVGSPMHALRATAQGAAAAERAGVVVELGEEGSRRRLLVDSLVTATGFRPELEMLRELRLELDPAVEAPVRLAPLIDPEIHSCGTVPAHGADVLAQPEDGFFLVGMKSYGRAPTFLLATGYEQVRSIAAHLAGADAAARDLVLPETGVCSASAPVEELEPVMIGVPTGVQHGRAGV
ncbi:FAD-dependent oxidoreductase [Nesterenkonia xinjiangensis]|uniref:Cation diffusion facilitator CzcD-associated flavoprotein CzcO n=1 Tax=Nesterenkonia xinjiangensis TaxID=225327 RepID=A0A7Z0GMN5_9MICC|nr:FAD-dependent oxidoreductase [Nesterenkonia xinjiangensis]NYJ78309.1 cation diffusion facilitator CzcD-associated flavoprotein CzcO [Nesterenkonia xinjiangensis]